MVEIQISLFIRGHIIPTPGALPKQFICTLCLSEATLYYFLDYSKIDCGQLRFSTRPTLMWRPRLQYTISCFTRVATLCFAPTNCCVTLTISGLTIIILHLITRIYFRRNNNLQPNNFSAYGGRGNQGFWCLWNSFHYSSQSPNRPTHTLFYPEDIKSWQKLFK